MSQYGRVCCSRRSNSASQVPLTALLVLESTAGLLPTQSNILDNNEKNHKSTEFAFLPGFTSPHFAKSASDNVLKSKALKPNPMIEQEELNRALEHIAAQKFENGQLSEYDYLCIHSVIKPDFCVGFTPNYTIISNERSLRAIPLGHVADAIVLKNDQKMHEMTRDQLKREVFSRLNRRNIKSLCLLPLTAHSASIQMGQNPNVLQSAPYEINISSTYPDLGNQVLICDLFYNSDGIPLPKLPSYPIEIEEPQEPTTPPPPPKEQPKLKPAKKIKPAEFHIPDPSLLRKGLVNVDSPENLPRQKYSSMILTPPPPQAYGEHADPDIILDDAIDDDEPIGEYLP